MRAELEILGLDASRHVVDYLRRLPRRARRRPAAATCSRRRSQAELLVAGVKVATQTPPIRSGRRVIFLTLDDATGPVDATFFEDAQGPYAATVFHSWLLVVRGELRRTGRRGVSLRATGCLGAARRCTRSGSADGRSTAVREQMAVVPEGFAGVGVEARSRGRREPRHRRVLVHSSGVPGCRRTPTSSRPARRHGPAPGAGALQRVPDVAVRRHQAGRRAPRTSPASSWHRSPGSAG